MPFRLEAFLKLLTKISGSLCHTENLSLHLICCCFYTAIKGSPIIRILYKLFTECSKHCTHVHALISVYILFLSTWPWPLNTVFHADYKRCQQFWQGSQTKGSALRIVMRPAKMKRKFRVLICYPSIQNGPISPRVFPLWYRKKKVSCLLDV